MSQAMHALRPKTNGVWLCAEEEDFVVRWILSTATKLFERVCSDRSARRREPLQVHASETNLDQPCSASKEPRTINGLGPRKLHRPLAGTFEDGCLTIGESEPSATLSVNLSRGKRYPTLPVDSSPRPPQAVDYYRLLLGDYQQLPVSGFVDPDISQSAFLRLYFTVDANLTKWRHLLSGPAVHGGPTARSNGLPVIIVADQCPDCSGNKFNPSFLTKWDLRLDHPPHSWSLVNVVLPRTITHPISLRHKYG
jgi:hypothetical protein